MSGYVKKGNLTYCDEYKYLGDIINKKENFEQSIKKKDKKSAVIKRLAEKSGNFHNKVALKLVKTCLLPVLTVNTETWTNISKREFEELEKIQKRSLYGIFNMKMTTTYYAFLSEVGILPVSLQILKKN